MFFKYSNFATTFVVTVLATGSLLRTNGIPLKHSRLMFDDEMPIAANHFDSDAFANSPNHHNRNPFEDYLVRQVRKDGSTSTGAKGKELQPYLQFRTKPPVALTVQRNSKYVLECEVQGLPKPVIRWTRNGQPISQGDRSVSMLRDTNPYGKLSLSMVKSRLFLDCITGADHGAIYTCVASTPEADEQYASTKIFVDPQTSSKIEQEKTGKIGDGGNNNNELDKELEYFSGSNINAIDTNSFERNHRLAATFNGGCRLKKSQIASPARIFFWTVTILENIGSDAVIHCRATGSPKPAITWYDSNGEMIVPDTGDQDRDQDQDRDRDRDRDQDKDQDHVARHNHRFRYLHSGDLLIRNVTFADMGVYRCVAQNRFGSDSTEKAFLYPTANDTKS